MLKHNKGSVLIYSLVLMALLLGSALSLATLSSYGTQTSRRLIDSIPAYYASESCLEQLLNSYTNVADQPHIYISGDSSDPPPTSTTPTLNPNATASFGIPANCTTNMAEQKSSFTCPDASNPQCPTPALTSPTTVTVTDSLTITSYGTFGRSTEGLSATINRK